MLRQRIVSYPDIKVANEALARENDRGWRAVSVSTSTTKGFYNDITLQVTYLVEKQTEPEEEKDGKQI